MPRGTWTAKRERQYEHILESCMNKRGGKKSKKTCQRIAAATVNKARSSAGETISKRALAAAPDCGCGG